MNEKDVCESVMSCMTLGDTSIQLQHTCSVSMSCSVGNVSRGATSNCKALACCSVCSKTLSLLHSMPYKTSAALMQALCA